MRATTMVWIGAKNVGSPHDGILIHEGTFVECLKELAVWLAKKSINKCVDIVLARTKDEALNRLNQERSARSGIAATDDIEHDLMAMLAAAGANESE